MRLHCKNHKMHDPRRQLGALTLRAGISLTEVLISMGIMAVGLLGAASLFPVGGHYLRQGDVSDRADAIAQAALSDAVARGMLDPENWLVTRVLNPNRAFYDTSFTTQLQNAHTTATKAIAGGTSAAAARRQTNLGIGSIFVIDPLGIAETMSTRVDQPASPAPGLIGPSMGFFPASTNFPAPFAATSGHWRPWALVSPETTGVWPVRRLTVATGALPIPGRPIAPMIPQAEAMVISNDDLVVEFGDDADDPAQQRLEDSSVGALSREASRAFSWLLTVVPTTPHARDALATNAQSFNYDVSAVVYYKRTTGGVYDQTEAATFLGHDSAMLSERQVRAAAQTRGIGGGQVRLYTANAGERDAVRTVESPVENFKPGQWIMLFGPHPESDLNRPLLFCQWYRVIAIEGEEDADGDSRPDPFVFLKGPDWPWAPDSDPTADDPAILSNDLRAVIVPDVAAVHTRTMKLSPGSVWGVD